MKHISALMALAAACAPVPGATAEYHRATEHACDEPDTAALRTAIETFLSEHPDFSGRILANQCGRTIFDRTQGLADRAAGTSISDRTVFDIGSLTKQMTAASILRLRDQGRLSLDDRLDRWFDGLSEDKAAITIHQLLTHNAGMPLYSGGDYDPRSAESFEEWFRNTDLDRIPGSGYAYSNTDYGLLALIVERLSGESYDAFLRREFFEPLGLEEIGYLTPKGPLVTQYDAEGASTGTPRDHAWAEDGPYWNLRGNGGLLANPTDLMRWVEALRGGEVLSAESTRAIFAPHQPTGDGEDAYGYGWTILSDEHGRWFTHGGSNGESFYTLVRYFSASDATLVFAANHFDIDMIRTLVRSFAAAAAPVD